MTEEGIQFLSSCINDFVEKPNWISFVKQNNIIKMRAEDFAKITFNSDKYVTYYHEYVSANMAEAYEPILTVCKDIISENNLDIKEVLDRIEVYALHKSVFLKYFRGEECNRDEELIVPEIEFEKAKFYEDLGKLLAELTKDTPVFILINKINLACGSALAFMLYLAKTKYKDNVKIMCISNELGNVAPYIKDDYTEIKQYCANNKLMYEWPYNIVDENVDIETGFVFKTTDMDEYYDKINTMFNSMAHEQAMYYLSIIYQKIELEKLNATPQFKIAMLCYYAWLNIFKMNASYALLICDSLKQIECEDEVLNAKREYEYNYLVSNANMYNGNESGAKKSVKKALEVANEIGDDFLIFKAMLLNTMTDLAGWKDIWICEKEIDIPDKLLESCKKYRYFNHLAHIYVYYFDNDYRLYRVIDDLKESIPNVNLGIKIAEELKNYQFLMEAYRKNIMMASYNGLFSVSNYFYNKSILIAKKTNNKIEEANIYNGLGYNSSSADHFEDAQDYFCKALKIYYDNKMSDYIVETLYNMGMNAILAEDYNNATEYLTLVVDILRLLKKNSIRVCNISKIFGLVALSTYREGNYYLSQFYLNKAEQFLCFILDYEVEEFYSYLWDDDMFLYYFVSALIDTKEGKYESAIDNYKKAKVFVEHFSGSAFFNYPQFMLGFAQAYKLNGNEDRYTDILLEGREKCNMMGNHMRVKQFDELLDGMEMTPINQDMSLRGELTLEQIMEFARVESIEMEAMAKKKDIQFFTTFQELINHPADSVDVYIQNMMSTFKNNFNLDNVLFISCEDNGREIKYSDIEYTLSDESINKIIEYFKDKSVGFALSQFSNNYHEYKDILDIFRSSKVFSITGVPIRKNDQLTGVFIAFVKIQESWNSSIDRDIMDEDDLEIFAYVFRQIIDALDKFYMNQLLRKQAETDQLTGLYNRTRYYEAIEDSIEQAAKRKETLDMAIIYADLDHFKYYNDNFGHSVGDAILVEFANIFKEVSKGRGWVVRFGGDEFIIVLNTADYNEVKGVVDDIYKAIERAEGFEKMVGKYLSANIKIESENRTSCSIGVAMAKNVDNVDKTAIIMQHADDALYRVKRNGRGYAEFVPDVVI